MKYYIANWKMNMPIKMASTFMTSFSKNYVPKRGTRIVICPSFLALPLIAKKVRTLKQVYVGSQDAFWAEQGNFTGEVSPGNLHKLGVQYAILGHSERRQIVRETDAMVNKKVLEAINENIVPILCVGENQKERNTGKTRSVITRELTKGLKNIPKSKELLIAYEPIWAISKKGKGAPMTTDIIASEISAIIGTLKKLGVYKKINNVGILYGGSVGPSSISDIMKVPGVNGVLVGNASLSPKSFNSILSC